MTEPFTFNAQYVGICADCGEPFDRGTLIRRADDGHGYAHAECPTDTPPATTQACPVCWLQHPEGACDR